MIKKKMVISYTNKKNDFRIQRSYLVKKQFNYDVYIQDKVSNKWLILDSFLTLKEAENYLKELENNE